MTPTYETFDRPTPNSPSDFEWFENAPGIALKSCKRRDAIEIVLPEGVESIGAGAFSDCRALRKISLPESVESIGEQAFSSCQALESATLPDSAPDAVWRVFRGVSIRLTPTANPRLRLVDDVLFTADGKTLLRCARHKVGEYVIPEGVESIGGGAFSGCRKLQGIAFPAELRSIGDGAFADCFALESVALPEGVESIGVGVFLRCFALKSVALPSGLRSIGDRAFYCCFALKSIEFPVELRSIGDYAFFFCRALKSATFPDSAPDSVWRACRGRSIRLTPTANPRLRAVDGVLFTADGKTLLSCPRAQEGKYVVPDGVASIGDEAFSGCGALSSVALPTGLRSVGARAFYRCNALRSVTLSDELESIAAEAFGYDVCGNEKIDDFTLCGAAGSVAERYALENGFRFEAR